MMNRESWSFVCKVYAILSLLLLATIGVGTAIRLVPSISDFLLKTHTGIAVCVIFIIMPLVVLIPMLCLRDLKYWLVPTFIVSLAFQVGITCVFTPGLVILESVCLSAVTFVGVTLYTFWAASRDDHEFGSLGPLLMLEVLNFLIIYVLIQVPFPLGKIGVILLGALGYIVFCSYIVYETYVLVERHSTDNDYVWAVASLYPDITHLFYKLIRGCCQCLGECCANFLESC